MIAIILAAGPTRSTKKTGFPEDSKPKCLFHYGGLVTLERQVRVLRKAGIDEIILVGGYKIYMIIEFNEDKKLGLKIVYSPTASSDHVVLRRGWAKCLDSVKVGLRGLDDDVLIIFGDSILCEKGLKQVMEHSNPCVSGYHIYKIPRELLPKLRNFNATGHLWALHDFCMANNGVKIWNFFTQVDTDSYFETQEGQKAGITK